jgi:hypothetical protein
MKKLIVFDLDGTLAESKSSLDTEMAALFSALLNIVKVAVISGGDWPQFEKQVLSNLPHDEHLKNLSLLPTCGTKFYQYADDWKKIYSSSRRLSQLASSLQRSGASKLKTGEARLHSPRWGSRLPSKKRKNGTLTLRSGRR